jgi:hypothetical protein
MNTGGRVRSTQMLAGHGGEGLDLAAARHCTELFVGNRPSSLLRDEQLTADPTRVDDQIADIPVFVDQKSTTRPISPSVASR